MNEPLIETTQNPNPNEQGNNNGLNPSVDIFNSAGNTTISGDQNTETQANYTENKTNEGTGNTTEAASAAPKGQVRLGKVLKGETTVAIFNIFLPAFIVFALRKYGYSTDKKQFKLTVEEKEILNPVVQDCLDYIVINFDNPFYTLAFVATMVYGAKVMDVVPDLKKIKEDLPEENDDDETSQEQKPTSSKKEVPAKFKETREAIDGTTMRKAKVEYTIKAIENESPSTLKEACQVYLSIFPERSEKYFREWYYKNYESMPDAIKFPENG